MTEHVVCKHVANAMPGYMVEMHGDKKSNRICCPACFKKGFLDKPLAVKDGKHIGEIKK